jgi:hypothetical protein
MTQCLSSSNSTSAQYVREPATENWMSKHASLAQHLFLHGLAEAFVRGTATKAEHLPEKSVINMI